MTDKFKEDYDLFYREWGVDSQIQMCIEEMSELIKALCKYGRSDIEDKNKSLTNVKEEIADVLNMVEQLEFIFGVDEIEDIRQEKIDRTKQLLFKSGN